MDPTISTIEDAVARIGATDTIGVPLGPGQPGAFLHGLGARDDYSGLTISGALLVDFYEMLLQAGCPPSERFLRSDRAHPASTRAPMWSSFLPTSGVSARSSSACAPGDGDRRDAARRRRIPEPVACTPAPPWTNFTAPVPIPIGSWWSR